MGAQGYIGRSPGDSSNIIARQTYTPTGITTNFTFASTYSVGYIDAYLNGVRLVEGNDFTATDGSVVGLTTHAQNGDIIELVAYKTFNATNVTAANNDFSVAGNLSVTGVSTFTGAITATGGVVGDVTGDATGLSGTPDITIRNLTGVAATFTGVLSYDDVTNVDSVGIITARSHVAIADSILHIGDTDTSIRFPAADNFTVETGGSERFRVGPTGIATFTGNVSLTAGGAERLNIAHVSGGDVLIKNPTDAYLAFGTNDSERVRISNSGRIGIGTDDPQTDFQIDSSTETTLSLFEDGRKFGALQVQGSSNFGTILYSYNGNPLIFSTNSGTGFDRALTIDTSQRLLVGSTSARTNTFNASAAPQVQVEGTNANLASIGIFCSANDTDGGRLLLAHQRSGGIGGNTIVNNNDITGSITFQGNDGSEFVESAAIKAEVDGAPGANDMPGRLTFYTTSDGGSSPTERARIDSSGNLQVSVGQFTVGTTASTGLQFINDGTFGTLQSAPLKLRTNSAERMRIDTSGRLLINTDTSRIVEDHAGNGPQGLIQIEGQHSAAIQSIISASTIDANRCGTLSLGRHRNDTVGGTPTVVQSGDSLGAICFAGGDGTDMRTKAAKIFCQVDGTPGSNDMPGRLVFSTTADGAASPTERLRINNGGFFNFNQQNNNNLYGRINIFEGGNFTTASQPGSGDNDNIYLISDTTSADGGYGASIAWSRIQYADRRAAAIASVQTTSDEDQVGLAFFTHPSTDASAALVEAMRVDHAGRLLIGSTQRTVGGVNCALHVEGTGADDSSIALVRNTNGATNPPYLMFGKSRSGSLGGDTAIENGDLLGYISFNGADGNDLDGGAAAIQAKIDATPGSNDMPGRLEFLTTPDGNNSPSIRATIDRNGSFMIHTTSINSQNEGAYFNAGTNQQFHQVLCHTTSSSTLANLYINRQSSDGRLIEFRQADNTEGHISVSGSTISYNGGHLTRWSQPASGAEFTGVLRGSVLSNTNEMCEWSHDAQDAVLYSEGDELPEGVSVGDVKTPAKAAYTEDNEQLNRMKISDVEGDRDVAGVFQEWDADEEFPEDFYCAMTGDFVIRIAKGTTVARGDLLMSAGDGTAKPQDDDIVRSKTIAKVTSTTVSETYSDGSYCVPCVLMAC